MNFFLKTDKIKALLISTLIVTGITLPFLVTILEHKSVGIYRVFTDYFTDLATVKTFSLKFNNLYIQESINDDVMTYFNISTIILFLCTTISFVFNKKDKYKKDRKILLVFIIIVINIICSQVIWEYVPKLFLSIQFPWRLLIFLALMISLYSPMILLSDRITNNKKNIISFIFIVMILFEGMNNISFYMDKEVSVEDALKSKLALGHQNEYFPHLEVEGIDQMFYSKRRYPVKKYEFITDKNISIDIINDDFPNMEIVVENVNDDTVVEFPRIHYLGYELVSDDGDKIELCNSKNGLLKATINENGTYKLSYVKTILHRLAEFIRLLTVLLMMGYLAVKFVKWQKRKL